MTSADDATQWLSLGAAGVLLAGLLRLAQKFVGTVTDGALSRVQTLEQKVDQLERQLQAEREHCDQRIRELERRLSEHQRNQEG